jgi:predicted transcriptional regulator
LYPILLVDNRHMSLSPISYRDRIYIVEDIILKLVEHGELNQTALVSFCGLNLKKHRCILDELQVNGFINKSESPFGRRIVAIYKPTQKGIEFCRSILEPYEKMFPRRKESVVYDNSNSNKEEKPTEQLNRLQEEVDHQQEEQHLRLITT